MYDPAPFLLDPWGRKLSGLRMALTPRCNMRCAYCHHEGETECGREISKVMAVATAFAAADLGMRSIKITGGEPLMRTDLEEIISEMPRGLEISMTTNGLLLEGRAQALKRAGLKRVNISLDSLDPETYARITGAEDGDLERVLRGIDAAIAAGLTPVKINVVVLEENEREIPAIIDFAREKGLIVQLIDLVDLKGRGSPGDLSSIEADLQARAERVSTREMHRRKKYFVDGAEIEVVRPMDNTEFCANCTRLRITSDGRIKPCLLRSDNLIEIDTCDVEEIKVLIKRANALREPFFKPPNR